MHTLTISIQGAANDSTSVELPDDQALPVYVKLKEVLAGTRSARRATRKDSSSAAADGAKRRHREERDRRHVDRPRPLRSR